MNSPTSFLFEIFCIISIINNLLGHTHHIILFVQSEFINIGCAYLIYKISFVIINNMKEFV